MEKKRFPFPLLFIAIIFWISTIYSIVRFPPSYTFSLLLFTLPLLPFILLAFGLSLFCTITFATRSLLHGTLLSITTLVYLLLRLIGLTSLFFLILLLAICIVGELLFLKKK